MIEKKDIYGGYPRGSDAEFEWMRDTVSLLLSWVQTHDSEIAAIKELMSRPRGGEKI